MRAAVRAVGLTEPIERQRNEIRLDAAPGVLHAHLDDTLDDGKIIAITGLTGSILHTPGHTEGSVCLYLPRESLLLAGDTLFAGSIGRTDLPGGDQRKILASIRESLLPLPLDTTVIPGHGSRTTIGAERESNPFLQYM